MPARGASSALAVWGHLRTPQGHPTGRAGSQLSWGRAAHGAGGQRAPCLPPTSRGTPGRDSPSPTAGVACSAWGERHPQSLGSCPGGWKPFGRRRRRKAPECQAGVQLVETTPVVVCITKPGSHGVTWSPGLGLVLGGQAEGLPALVPCPPCPPCPAARLGAAGLAVLTQLQPELLSAQGHCGVAQQCPCGSPAVPHRAQPCPAALLPCRTPSKVTLEALTRTPGQAPTWQPLTRRQQRERDG